MDNNEQIVRAWFETQGFLVQNRLKYKVSRGTNSGWRDIDLIAYRPSDGKRVAVDVTAWMTSKIRYSDVTNPNQGINYRLSNITSKESRAEIRKAFGVKNNKEYEIWHVVSFISDNQREQVTKSYLKYVNRVVEFPDIMKDLIEFIKQNPNVTQETETLQTIRALILCGFIKD
jgi:hypothetical protein